MRFRFEEHADWPPLAWIASWGDRTDEILVQHGRRVEVHSDWFGEVIWNGDFAEAAFDQTDVVFGSGAKIRNEDEVVFVGSSTTLDRLLYLKQSSQNYVSNSLPCLMAKTNAVVDVFYANYFEDFRSIIHGLDDYQRSLKTSAGEISLVYFDNVVWQSGQFQVTRKPMPTRRRETFEQYATFLTGELCALAENAADHRRTHNWSLMGTTSTGFDSTTVSALATKAGLKQVIAMNSSRGGKADCGNEVAKHLGLQTEIVDRDGWRRGSFNEVPFLASDAKGEDVYFSSAQSLLENRVVLTGFCGSIWGGRSESYIRMKRSDQSGLSLTEYRLWAGFINIPVPTIGVYEGGDLLDLMGSPEAGRWASGRDYDKPFCRYVLTEAGVPSDLYGVEKKAASVLIHDRSSFLSEDSLHDFQAYWNRQLAAAAFGDAKFRLRSTGSRINRRLAGGLMSLARYLHPISRLKYLGRIGHSVRLGEYANGDPRFPHLFPWAIEHAKRRYG